MNLKKARVHIFFVLFIALFFSHAYSQEAVQPESELIKIKGDIYQVTNTSGGNIVVFLDEDSTLVVDTGWSAEDAERTNSAISKVSSQPIRLVVNTHWHTDHVGGNEKMNELGATIIAHDNVKKRMKTEQYIEFLDNAVPRAPEKAIPNVTFSRELKLKIDGEDIHIFQVQQGHTDTDAVVFFKSANVIHVGDLYFNGLYPYIGISSGGSINDMITVINTILPKLDDNTIIIPGHGPLSNKAEFITYINMLATIRDRIQAKIKEGRSLEEITASKPTSEYDDPWGLPWLQGDDFVRLVHMDLTRTDEKAKQIPAVPESIEVSKYVDTEAAGWAHKKNDVAYSAEIDGCQIQWNVVEYKDNLDKYSIYKKSSCTFPLSRQIPIHRAILAKIVEDYESARLVNLSWGSFGRSEAKHWSWSIPMAMASSKSAEWKKYLANYPDVTKSSNEIFVELAIESNVYSDLRLLFNEFGLDIELSSVEKVFAMKADELPFYDQLKALGLEGNPKLTYDVGMSYFTIRTKDAP